MAWGFYTRSSLSHGCVFHPCESDDPRGRFFVRAGFAKTCALRAPTVFSARINTIRAENTVMQLPRNDCHIRANVFVILVAANGRAKTET